MQVDHMTCPDCLQSRRNVLLYAGGAVAAVAGLGVLLTGGPGGSTFSDVDSKERASIGGCRAV